MFYIFEMANNHMGDVEHGLKIIDHFGLLANKYKLNAGIKFQFRQLETFIHPDYKKSSLKFIKRFNETKLEKKEFRILIEEAKKVGLKTVATPFDNESLPWLEDLDIEVIKVASCSVDDWPLLDDICKINKRIIISTGGADFSILHKVYDLFKKEKRDFSFLHCVGEYPTPNECANLNRINLLKQEFSDIEIGFSTHESPKEKSLVPVAIAMGCTIVEKHVGVPTNQIKLNNYSCSPEEMEIVIRKCMLMQTSLFGVSFRENQTLRALKRGIYLKQSLEEHEIIDIKNIYYALPLQEGQADASMIERILGKNSLEPIEANSPVYLKNIKMTKQEEDIYYIKEQAKEILASAHIYISDSDHIEISCHYGLDNFFNTGVLIIEKVNRDYCKKLLCIFPNQTHPTHRHIRKEETFELLYGDCKLVLGDKEIFLQKGKPILIPRGVNHSFKSFNGAIVEEISTKHYVGDSIYDDPYINKLDIKERKIITTF